MVAAFTYSALLCEASSSSEYKALRMLAGQINAAKLRKKPKERKLLPQPKSGAPPAEVSRRPSHERAPAPHSRFLLRAALKLLLLFMDIRPPPGLILSPPRRLASDPMWLPTGLSDSPFHPPAQAPTSPVPGQTSTCPAWCFQGVRAFPVPSSSHGHGREGLP